MQLISFQEKDEQPVYETVDEAQYAELVRKRLEDDWIVDDGQFF